MEFPSHSGINKKLGESLSEFCLLEAGEFVLYRNAFRWMNMEENVMSNHYESMSVEQIAEDFGYEVVYNAKHAAIFKLKEIG